MSDEQDIVRRRAEFAAALNREDIATMNDYVTDDVFAMAPNRPAINGIDATRAFWREMFAVGETRLGILSGNVEVGGDMAIDRFQWTLDIASRTGAAATHDEGKCIWIWRRQADGKWRQAFAIWNSDLPAAS